MVLMDYSWITKAKKETRSSGRVGKRTRLPRKWRNKERIIERGYTSDMRFCLLLVRLAFSPLPCRSSPFPFDPSTDTEANGLILTWMLTRLLATGLTCAVHSPRFLRNKLSTITWIMAEGVERRDARCRRQPVRSSSAIFCIANLLSKLT